ncbi:hypothetical protein GCM10023196_098630 [Actinoallomurus vinaceus]|uniref:Endonuclease/exonuclease/phosphatase domain-containing protein n=1 Tax=Actinoallomurus vinaceus TaxID=1080074 RepID=A0ABP8UUK0_9ACTN
MTVVGTWNLENLFKPGGSFGPTSQAAYDAKLKGLAATITAAGVDVLAGHLGDDWKHRRWGYLPGRGEHHSRGLDQWPNGGPPPRARGALPGVRSRTR